MVLIYQGGFWDFMKDCEISERFVRSFDIREGFEISGIFLRFWWDIQRSYGGFWELWGAFWDLMGSEISGWFLLSHLGLITAISEDPSEISGIILVHQGGFWYLRGSFWDLRQCSEISRTFLRSRGDVSAISLGTFDQSDISERFLISQRGLLRTQGLYDISEGPSYMLR